MFLDDLDMLYALEHITWVSPLAQYIYFVVSTLAFEAAFLCWWRFFAIRDSVQEPDVSVELGVKVSSLLLAFAVLFTTFGVAKLTTPASHATDIGPWDASDWWNFAATIGEIFAALWAARMMTMMDCGEKIWVLMFASSAGCGLLLTWKYGNLQL
jgi:hypothetical protein